MRRILVSCAVVGVLALPAATLARASAAGRPGYVVVTKAVGNGGVNGSPVVTVVVRGFVLGRVSAEGEVRIFQLPSVGGQGGPQVTPGVSTKSIRWRPHAAARAFTGKQYTGSNFRFRATGGLVPRRDPRCGRVSLRRWPRARHASGLVLPARRREVLGGQRAVPLLAEETRNAENR